MISDFFRSHSNSLEKVFEFLIFAGCFIFVIFQGEQCITKYLEKPEAVTTSFDFAGKHPFPEITLCPQPMNQLNPPNPNYPKPLNSLTHSTTFPKNYRIR